MRIELENKPQFKGFKLGIKTEGPTFRSFLEMQSQIYGEGILHPLHVVCSRSLGRSFKTKQSKRNNPNTTSNSNTTAAGEMLQ